MNREDRTAVRKRPIKHLRWWIAGLLFLVSFINYVDRQTLSALAPFLKDEFGWSNDDYGMIVNAFQVSYTVMQMVVGRLLDVVGVRAGIAASVAFYSLIGAMTAAAVGLKSFSLFRFFLGAGEAANNPGGSKAISEWFPARERAWAVAIFNSGCAMGSFAAPFIAVWVYHTTGHWQPAFIVAATLGALWLAAWLWFYKRPEDHPRLSEEERDYILSNRSSSVATSMEAPVKIGWGKVLRYRQTWGLMLGRFLLDPFWFFVANWFAVFLRDEKHFSLSGSALGLCVPMLGAAFGNFFAGGLSSALVQRGWQPGKARRALLLVFGPAMALISLSLWVDNYVVLLLISACCTFAYNCCSTMFLTLPTDVFHTRAVGTVMGLAGASAGVGTFITTAVIGYVSTRYSFAPIIIMASVIPVLATVVFVSLVRAGKKPDPEGILLDF